MLRALFALRLHEVCAKFAQRLDKACSNRLKCFARRLHKVCAKLAESVDARRLVRILGAKLAQSWQNRSMRVGLHVSLARRQRKVAAKLAESLDARRLCA